MKRNQIKFLIISTFVASLASAGTVVAPVSATSSLNGDAGSNVDYLLIDNAGYANPGLHDGSNAVLLVTGTDLDIALATFADHSNVGQKESFVTAKDVHNPIFIFDLGADTAVDSIILWGYGNWAGDNIHVGENGPKDFSLIFNTEAEGGSDTDFDFDNAGSIEFSGTAMRVTNRTETANTAQNFPFTQVTARYIAMRIDTNQGGPRDGLGEVRFSIGGEGVTVPQPILVISGSTIEFDSVPTADYTIYSSQDLTDDSGWKVLTNITATSSNTVFDVAQTNSAEFYRGTTP